MKDFSPGVYLLILGHEVHRIIKYWLRFNQF
jgi:hypothetical protein